MKSFAGLSAVTKEKDDLADLSPWLEGKETSIFCPVLTRGNGLPGGLLTPRLTFTLALLPPTFVLLTAQNCPLSTVYTFLRAVRINFTF